MDSQGLGAQGEQIAADYLLTQGYQIQERNFKARKGEIDIIALDQDVLAFVEVKYYKVNSLRDPHDAVDLPKQRKIITAAEVYMAKHQITDKYTRFDVVLITPGKNTQLDHIELYKDAFRP